MRQHTSAYVSIRQHTSAYVSIRQHMSAYVSIRHVGVVFEHLADVSEYVRPHTHTSIRQHTSAYVSIRQHTTAYVAFGGCLRICKASYTYTSSLSLRPDVGSVKARLRLC
jgi:hypothetical protein